MNVPVILTFTAFHLIQLQFVLQSCSSYSKTEREYETTIVKTGGALWSPNPNPFYPLFIYVSLLYFSLHVTLCMLTWRSTRGEGTPIFIGTSTRQLICIQKALNPLKVSIHFTEMDRETETSYSNLARIVFHSTPWGTAITQIVNIVRIY